MKIAFFVNAIADEFPRYTTTILAYECTRRGHEVCYVTPSSFALMPDNSLKIHGYFPPLKKFRTSESFFKAIQKDSERKTVDIAEFDVLMLRNDPSNDAVDRPWAAEVGTLFGKEAEKRGVLVLNDPDGLSNAVNKLYFQNFPEEARAETLITKNEADIKEFSKKHQGKIILKPLQGSGGQGVFLMDKDNASNLNQTIEAVERDGYVIAQAYVPAASKGDIRMFLMNGQPLKVGNKYAALRRTNAKDDIRSNVHAGGKSVKVEITETELRVAEVVRPKLIEDGMFLVGIDIVGDKILEVNVFSPGNLLSCNEFNEVNFCEPIIESIERKIEIRKSSIIPLSNQSLATM